MMNAPLMANKSLVLEARHDPVSIPPMPDYNRRVLAYMGAAAILVAGLW